MASFELRNPGFGFGNVPRMTVKEALSGVLSPAGKTIVDVGCGDGAMVRHLAREGARAIGVEVSDAQLARAKAKASGQESYSVGRGEDLPFDDCSADALLYLNSLHHLPADSIPVAIVDAARVLKAGGQLIVIEPIAAGSYFEALRPLEDETEIRARAYAALQNPPSDLAAEGEFIFESAVRLRDADHFIQVITAPEPSRRARLPEVEGELRRRFKELAQIDADGFLFLAPMRRNLFRKIA